MEKIGKEDIMTEQYKPIYLPTMINIKLTDKERERCWQQHIAVCSGCWKM